MSPRLHSAALEAAGIEGSYTARRVDRAGMEAAFDELRVGSLHGANVTMPHKGLAAELADELSPTAARAGSVNTLVRRGGGVAGDSTDVAAIRQAWGRLSDKRALVLGAGGAAAAALLALEGRPLLLAARRPVAARRLLDRTGVAASVLEWGVAAPGAVVVNATPLGMHHEGLPHGVLEAAGGLFDMPYASGPTPAVARARSLGIPVVEGIEMLLSQASLSFELWTGIAASYASMRAALVDDHSPGSNL